MQGSHTEGPQNTSSNSAGVLLTIDAGSARVGLTRDDFTNLMASYDTDAKEVLEIAVRIREKTDEFRAKGKPDAEFVRRIDHAYKTIQAATAEIARFQRSVHYMDKSAKHFFDGRLEKTAAYNSSAAKDLVSAIKSMEAALMDHVEQES